MKRIKYINLKMLISVMVFLNSCQNSDLEQGDKEFVSENYEEAIRRYDLAINIDSTNAELYFKKSKSYFNVKNYEKALENINKALLLSTDSNKYFCQRGNIYYVLHVYEKAIRDYNIYIKLGGKNVEAYCNICNILVSIGNYDEAKDNCQICIHNTTKADKKVLSKANYNMAIIKDEQFYSLDSVNYHVDLAIKLGYDSTTLFILKNKREREDVALKKREEQKIFEKYLR